MTSSHSASSPVLLRGGSAPRPAELVTIRAIGQLTQRRPSYQCVGWTVSSRHYSPVLGHQRSLGPFCLNETRIYSGRG